MASLRDQLLHVLDVEPPRGLVGWIRGTPFQQAIKVVRGREAEALRALEALLAEPAASEHLQANAMRLLAHLYVATATIPSAEDIYRARHAGVPFDPHRELKAALARFVASPRLEVRVAAAVELLRIADPGDLRALRLQLADLLPVLRERRFEDPAVHQAVLDLGGKVDVLAWLEELAAHPGALPPHLEGLLLALEREPDPAAAPLLRRIFPRLDAVARRGDPVRQDIGGVPAWDAETVRAVLVLRAYLQVAPSEEVAPSVELLRAPSPAMAAVLLAETAPVGGPAAVLAGAAARDATLPPPVRGAGVATLANIAQTPASPAKLSAIEQLQRLRADPTVGAPATRALADLAEARS